MQIVISKVFIGKNGFGKVQSNKTEFIPLILIVK